MNYPYTEHMINTEKQFLLENMMGPNVVRVSEELASLLPIDGNTKILDLACGTGLSSIFLAEEYGSIITSADLWISPNDNKKRFADRGLSNKITACSVDVTKGLPFATAAFDLIFCIDAYHYFGGNEQMLPFLLTFLKQGGYIAVAIPGLKKEFENGTPEELQPFLPENANFHSLEWWKKIWSKKPEAEILHGYEMECHSKAWDEWLQSPNPYAAGDIGMMAAEKGNYFNHVGLITQKK